MADGNSVVVVDHDTRVLAAMDHLVEMGPTAGAEGGHVIAQGAVADVMTAPWFSDSILFCVMVAKYMSGRGRRLT